MIEVYKDKSFGESTIFTKVGAKVKATISFFFLEGISPVEKSDTYRRKNKVLTTCVGNE